MAKSYNFKLDTSAPLSKQCLVLNLADFQSILKYILHLPYGRNTNRSDYTLVLKEQKGTCSTKHAFLKQLAIENEQEDVKLILCIYKMNGLNTNGISSILKKYSLDHIPEAHTYLKVKNNIIDVTRTTVSEHSFEDSILFETQILPSQIAEYKVVTHQNYLKNWVVSEQTNYSFEEIWRIREACITALNQ